MTERLVKIWLSIFLFVNYSCKKNTSSVQNPSPYFIKASFNGTPWKLLGNTRFGSLRFGANLDHYDNTWSITLISDNVEADTLCRGIIITFDYVPSKGKHYFNNVPLGYLPDSGLIGIYSYYNQISNTWEPRYSLDGYVNVTEISRDEIQGSFTFNATSGNSTDSAIIAVTDGLFYLPNYGGSDYWPGP